MRNSPESADEHVRSLHKGISRNSYMFEDGMHVGCDRIADHLVELLQDEGKNPLTAEIIGEQNKWGVRRNLSPVPYKSGYVLWGAHFVAHAEGIVYDPVIESPVPWSEYIRRMFKQTVVVSFGDGRIKTFSYTRSQGGLYRALSDLSSLVHQTKSLLTG